MNYLVVVAHPDDEVLGVGATMAKLSDKGHEVTACILSGEAKARSKRPSDDELDADISRALLSLGVKQVIKGNFPNIMFNTVPHLEMVQFIEKAIIKTKCDVIFTHHPSDTNNDHLETSLACQAAMRLFQRCNEVKPIKELLFMEVPSATDWSVNTSMNAFRPNTFVESEKSGIDRKINALSMYRDVTRDYPHPRSHEAITGLAAYRGAQSGLDYAEAFECVFRRGL